MSDITAQDLLLAPSLWTTLDEPTRARMYGAIQTAELPPDRRVPAKPGAMVADKYGARYVHNGYGRWFLLDTTQSLLLEVPYESIIEPYVDFEGYTVVTE